ncbi:transcription termination/antitermination NusG family protein [Hoeflea sp.]|uniref:transcription termination/antitermination protein NusG n=1 Tax=Hoeflea sp. TaxID=1940281 RepID=UPI0019AF63C9|nr:transcription termination/antitermination NusG family protein [Hoeflea sp.]MBC7282622.1 hypothetical protein [Hoeflea sp.]
MTWRVGDTVSIERCRDIVSGPETAPEWYALIVQSQRMARLRDGLRGRGIYTFYPSEEVQRRDRRGNAIMVERPYISGLIYSQFRQAPQWDVMKSRGLIYGVVSHGCYPVRIHPDVIRHLQGMTVEQERLEEARREMMRVREGDTAKVLTPTPLGDYMVEVTSITGGVAWFEYICGDRRIPGSAPVDALERLNEA